MQRFRTRGIIIRRVDYGEADRIITFLTPDMGKVGALAKAVRKPKSKLAGGIELLSVSDISLIKGRGKLYQLVSSRLKSHFREIIADYDRLQIAYLAVELIDKLTETEAGKDYYELLKAAFEELNDTNIDKRVVEVWLRLRLAAIHGHQPDTLKNRDGKELDQAKRYEFLPEDGIFIEKQDGNFSANEIKSWRLLLTHRPSQLKQVSGLQTAAAGTIEALRSFYNEQFQLG